MRTPTSNSLLLSQCDRDLLIDPYNKRLGSKLIAGRGRKHPLETHCRLWLSEREQKDFARHLNDWFKSWNIEKLCSLLSRYPKAIAHPAVFEQLMHLRKISTMPTEEDAYTWGGDPEDEDIVSKSVQSTARNWLLSTLDAWNSAMLFGYRLRALGQAGSPRKTGHYQGIHQFIEFDTLREDLREIEEREAYGLMRRPAETDNSYVQRLKKIVETLHQASSYGYSTRGRSASSSIDTPALKAESQKNHLSGRVTLPIKKAPLPKTIAAKIVKQSLGTRGVQRHKLLTGLFAHYLLKDHRKWKTIQRRFERISEEQPRLDSARQAS